MLVKLFTCSEVWLWSPQVSSGLITACCCTSLCLPLFFYVAISVSVPLSLSLFLPLSLLPWSALHFRCSIKVILAYPELSWAWRAVNQLPHTHMTHVPNPLHTPQPLKCPLLLISSMSKSRNWKVPWNTRRGGNVMRLRHNWGANTCLTSGVWTLSLGLTDIKLKFKIQNRKTPKNRQRERGRESEGERHDSNRKTTHRERWWWYFSKWCRPQCWD